MSLILPQALGALSFFFYDMILFIRIAPAPEKSQATIMGFLVYLSLITAVSYLLMSVQTIIYTVIMEILGIRILENSAIPQKSRYIITGTVLGGLAGLSLLALVPSREFPSGSLELFIIGPLIGFVMAELKMRSHLSQRKIS